MTVAHNPGTGYEVAETIERGIESRESAVRIAVRTARQREWPVYPAIACAPATR